MEKAGYEVPEQSLDLALIWMQKYVNANESELTRIKAQIKLLPDKSLEEKFDKRIKQNKIP